MNIEKTSQIPSIGMDQIDLLKKLSNASGVTGDEGEVRKIIVEAIKPFADEIKIDALGNVLAIRKSNSPSELKVMLAAHMDEVGFMVVDEEEGGIYQFEIVGHIDERVLPGRPVWVGHNHIPGIIGSSPIHLVDEHDLEQPIHVKDLRIDIGLDGAGKIKVGERAVFATTFQQTGPSLFGKALDDRLGIATLIEVFQNAPSNIELQAAFTVQEEIGLRGAGVAAYSLNPDVAFALDCTPANDFPTWDETENTRYNAQLGHGPAIYVADALTLQDPRLIHFLVTTAQTHGIPYQIRQPGGGATDAGVIHLKRAGIPTASISVPCRNLHNACSLANLSDWQNTFELLHTAVSELGPRVLEVERRQLDL
jgi:tetrahedral aminopeptidase